MAGAERVSRDDLVEIAKERGGLIISLDVAWSRKGPRSN